MLFVYDDNEQGGGVRSMVLYIHQYNYFVLQFNKRVMRSQNWPHLKSNAKESLQEL